MDVREKLVELLERAFESFIDDPYCIPDESCIPDEREFADHLIANGVTIQKWIPISEQKPDRDTLVLVFFEGMRDTNCAIQVMYGWCIGGSASHWMPLPEPPKGE